MAERRLIPHQADYPLEFTIEVTPPPAKTETGEWEGVAAVLLFVGFLVLVVVGVSRSRWRHGQPPSPVDVDSPGDTWWSG